MSGGPTRVLCYELTTDSGVNASGDAVGDRCEWAILREAGSRGGTLETVIVTLLSTEKPALDLELFSHAFTATADNAPWGPADEDLRDFSLGVVKIPAAAWSSGANNGHASVDNIGKAIACHQHNQAGIIYGQLVDRTGFTAVAMTVSIGVSVDLGNN